MADNKITDKIQLSRQAKVGLAYFTYLHRRIGHDRLTVTAGSMAYVTLLSLVPLITVVLAALSAFPVFAGLGDLLQNFVIENFVPAAGEVVKTYLNEFVANAGKMTAVGVGALFVVAMMLMSSIDQSLNYIWRVHEKRRPVISFSIYWMVLTLGPILVGSSIAVSSYFGSLTLLDSEAVNGLFQQMLRGLPAIMSSCAFLGLYLLVPNIKVKLSHALIGALTASVLFELSKKGFALYITNFPSYQVIYGALAVIPILFVWVYLCWCIVLLGAEITASLGERTHWLVAGDTNSDDSDKEGAEDKKRSEVTSYSETKSDKEQSE
ncbi:virulence factor BrkB family protein [Photobacterium sp.]|uniref:virulence factor BrkB family protein n=1 Tax=Photobacterium sp. TaxID=660 RepID=UPI00299D41C4|nr:virulence factor BrkB family protein [Photobacterium sp.]MDX1303967.1 virulence factor BrkB family protein [Photobacterium sp.]